MPSQNGWCLVRLQPQNQTSLSDFAKYLIGLKYPPLLCELSQKGCFLDNPQEHQK